MRMWNGLPNRVLRKSVPVLKPVVVTANAFGEYTCGLTLQQRTVVLNTGSELSISRSECLIHGGFCAYTNIDTGAAA